MTTQRTGSPDPAAEPVHRPTPADRPFRAVHRARLRARLRTWLTVGVAGSALLAVTWLVPNAVPTAAAQLPAVIDAPAQLAAPPEGTPAPTTLPSPAASAAGGAEAPVASVPVAGGGTESDSNATADAGVARPQAVVAGPREETIDVDTSGYQHEIDQCLWVRMDVGAVAPIVGAHNFCGGDIILELLPGDRVILSGEGLDGVYRVTGSRDAHAGDNASTATDGLIASVVLQTCYYDRDALRLVTLLPDVAPASG